MTCAVPLLLLLLLLRCAGLAPLCWEVVVPCLAILSVPDPPASEVMHCLQLQELQRQPLLLLQMHAPAACLWLCDAAELLHAVQASVQLLRCSCWW
jgi:hypothetical protein